MPVLPTWASFPNPVNDKAARTVAAGVVVLAAVALATASPWWTALLAVGFAARVLAGPRFSLLGRLATQVIAPRLGAARMVPGPPKRFAQAIGLIFTVSATVLFALDLGMAGRIVLGVLVVFALLESALGFCAGCWVFGLGIRLGLVPESVCVECANVWARYDRPSAATTSPPEFPSFPRVDAVTGPAGERPAR